MTFDQRWIIISFLSLTLPALVAQADMVGDIKEYRPASSELADKEFTATLKNTSPREVASFVHAVIDPALKPAPTSAVMGSEIRSNPSASPSGDSYKAAKKELQKEFDNLKNQLNKLLAKQKKNEDDYLSQVVRTSEEDAALEKELEPILPNDKQQHVVRIVLARYRTENSALNAKFGLDEIDQELEALKKSGLALGLKVRENAYRLQDYDLAVQAENLSKVASQSSRRLELGTYLNLPQQEGVLGIPYLERTGINQFYLHTYQMDPVNVGSNEKELAEPWKLFVTK